MLSAAKFTCYEGADDEESWLMAESCADTEALDALMVFCGAPEKTMFCETYKDFAGDGVDVILTASKRDVDGNGCSGTAPAKQAYSAFHYAKKTSGIQCDGFLPIMNFATPTKCKSEIEALNSMVEASTGEGFECLLSTQTTTATSTGSSTVSSTVTTSGSTTATSSLSNSGTTTVTSTATSSVSSTATTSGTTSATSSASSSATTSGTTTVSSTFTTTPTTTVTTDTLLGPLECVVYKEGSANEQKYLVQPKSGYSCLYSKRTLDNLLERCDELGLYPSVTLDASMIKCNKLPGMYTATFLADKTVAESSQKKECTVLPGLLKEMMKAFLAVGDHSSRVDSIMAADSFSCDQTRGTITIKEKEKCDDFALIVGTALEQFRDGRFDRCDRTTATSTVSSTGSSTVTTSVTTSITTTASTTASTSQTSSATTTQSNSQSTTITSTATTSASTTAVTTIFRHYESTCTSTSTYGRLYVNDDDKCTESTAVLTNALQLCADNQHFGSSSSPKEAFSCIDQQSSSLQLAKLSECPKSVVDMNAMMSEFRRNGLNTAPIAATFICQQPFGLIKVKCDSDDLNDLNSLVEQYKDGRFRSCEFTTQTSTATSSVTTSGSTSQTSSATTSFTSTATTTGTTFLPGRLSCAAYTQGSVTVYFIKGPPDTRTHDTTTEAERQSDKLDTILKTCVSKLDQSSYTDSLSFKTVNGHTLMYSTVSGKCADTAKRLNAMVQEYRRGGGHQRDDEFGNVACANDKTFYWLTQSVCESEIKKYNAAITGYDTGDFNSCHLTTGTTTVTTTQSNSGTTTVTTTATSTHSKTGVTTVTSTATSSETSTVTSSLTSTATSSRTSTGTSTVTSSGTTSGTTSQTSSASSTESSSATTTHSSTATTSESSTGTSSRTSSATSTATTSRTSTGTSSQSSTVTSSGTSSVTSTATLSATSTRTSTDTSTQTSSGTTTRSSTVSSTESSTQTTSVSSSATSSVSSTGTSSVTSTATSSFTTTATTSQTTSASTTATSSATSSVTSTETSTVTSSQSTTATSSQSATRTTTVTSTATSSLTSTGTTSETTTASTSITSSITSTATSTDTSSVTTTVTSAIKGRVFCSAASKQFLAVHGADNCNHQAHALNGFLKRCKKYDNRYSTDQTLECNEVIGDYLLGSDSHANCLKIATVLHHVVEEITEFEGNHGNTFTLACSMNSIQIVPKQNKDRVANCDLFASKLNDFIDTIVDGSYEADNCEVTSPTTTRTSTQTTTATTTPSNSQTTTVTTTGTSSLTTSATTSASTSASSTATTSASSSATTSQSSSATTSPSTSVTTSQSSSATTSQSSSASTSGSTSATSTATTTATGSKTSTATTTATTSATTSASSSATTSQSSSATTSQSSSATTSQSSSATSSLSTTATSTQSDTASSTQTSTATNTATTATTTETSTVTSKFFAKLVCAASGKNYLAAPNGKLQCEEQADMINEILADCSEFKPEYKAVNVVCNAQGGDYLLGGTSQDACKNVSQAMNYAVSEITQFPGARFDMQCTLNSMHVVKTDRDGDCSKFVTVLNDIIDKRYSGRFRHCTVSSPTTTQTSTATSSATTTVSSSVTSTASSTDSSSVTSSATSTQTSSASTSASSTHTSSKTTTATSSASTSATSSATSSVSSTETSSVSSTQTSSLTSTGTSSKSSTATSTASSTVSSSLTSSQTTSVSSTASTSATSTATSTMTSTVSSSVTSTASFSRTSTATTTATSSLTSTATSSRSTTGTSTGTTSLTSSATSSQTSSATTTHSSTVTTTISFTATSSQSSTATTTRSTTQTSSVTSTASSSASSTAVSTVTTTATSSATSTVGSTVTTTDTTTPTSTLSFSRSSTLTSTGTSTITTNNERNMVTLFFKADAKVVSGPKFKVGLATVLIANGVLEKALVDIMLAEGSIVADVHLDGMEYGRMVRDWTDAGLIVVVVDGVAYVAYSTYASVDPYAADNLCTGHVIGNLSFAMDDFGAPPVLVGFDSRNDTSLIPSEMYTFQADLELDLQYAVATYYTSNPDFYGEVCVTTRVVFAPAHAIEAAIILSNYSFNYDGITEADIQGASLAVALGHKAGEIVVDQIRDEDVSPGFVVLTAVDDAFFAPEEIKTSSAGLVGGIVGVLALCAVLFVLIYRAKRREDDAHTIRVKMAISPEGLQFFSDGMLTDNSTPLADTIWTMDKNGDGVITTDELAQFGLGEHMPMVRDEVASFNNSKTSPSAASVSSPGYFSVGEITSPAYLPGPGHFHPMAGASVMGVGSAPSFNRSPIASYGTRPSGTPSGRQTPRSIPMANPLYRESEDDFLSTQPHTGASHMKEGRPSLLAEDEYIDTTGALTSWGAGATQSPDDALSDSDVEWGVEAAWGSGPEGGHDFPTLKGATMKVSAGVGLSGYAVPQSPIEFNSTVHFAGVAAGVHGRPSLIEDYNDGGTADEEYGMAAIALASASLRP